MTKRVIDADGHICEPPALWNDYIEKRHRADAIRVERDPDGRDWISINGTMRRNLRPVVVLLMSHSFGNRASNEDLAQSLNERKVPVCRVYCEADLSETLSSFAVNNFSQDASWRRPVLSHLT
jgi:hypothetical protein